MGPFTDADRRVARLAERRYGFVTRAEALACGHTADSIRHRLATGRWEPVAAGVYRIAGAPRSWQGDAYAAVVTGPTDTVASYVTAAALFGLRPPAAIPHVTAPRKGRARSRLARVHRAPLAPADRTVVGVIPVTTPARTLVDCASVLAADDLCQVVDVAHTAGLIRPGSVEAAMARASIRPGRKGIPALRVALAAWAPGIEHDSPAEVRLFRLLAEWGLPTPVTLHTIVDADGSFVCEVDVAWPARLVALEYDSVAHHGPRRWATDDRRRSGAAALGWTVISVDKTDLRPGGHERLRSTLERLLLDPRLVRRTG